jgi:hypothetical protein
MTLLERYNEAYNLECAALPQGGPVSMEHLQAITLECMLKVTAGDWDVVFVDDVRNLIEELYVQGDQNG